MMEEGRAGQEGEHVPAEDENDPGRGLAPSE